MKTNKLMNIGDYVICKKEITVNKYGDIINCGFAKDQKYRIDNIIVHSNVQIGYSTIQTTVFWSKFSSTMVLQNGELLWSAETGISDKNRSYFINHHELSEYDMRDFFYTKAEERKLKLKKIYERG